MLGRRVAFAALLLGIGANDESCDAPTAARIDASNELLRMLAEDGIVHEYKLVVQRTPYGGLGIFAAENIASGSVIMQLPSSMMLGSGGRPASLPLALLHEKRNSSSAWMRAYIASLPTECPDNLATSRNAAADLALVDASLHAWKTDVLQRELKVLDADPAGFLADERLWATCMKLSRAFSGVGTGPVMIPFVDLLNHDAIHPTCTEKGRWKDEARGVWLAEVTAARDLAVGDELTYPYSESPSRARMLTSFGFAHGAPAASLASAQLPERDAAWLAQHSCDRPPRTDLYLDETSGVLTDGALRAALRCIRLRLYSADEAEWALQADYLDAPWGGPPGLEALRHSPDGARVGQLLSSILQKDLRIVSNTASMCRRALSDEQRREQRARLPDASEALREAIADESAALDACAEMLDAASEQIDRRGRELFGGE